MSKQKKTSGSVATELAEMVKGLPRLAKYHPNGQPIYKQGTMSGYEMNLSGAKDREGKPFIDHLTYTVPILQYVNHMEQIQSIYKKDGMVGAKEYVVEVMQRKADMEKEVEVLRGENVWWKRILRVLHLIK